jgi:dTDP-4-dehydrorhamnose 3,5-epimerase
MGNTIEFKINKTEIPGLLEIEMDLHEDGRGWFQEKFQRPKLVALGFPESFFPIQHSVSYNKDIGVTRGLHAEPWDKYVSVITGKVHAVYVDLRRRSDTYGKKVSIVIDSRKAVFVPQGVANSFQTLEPETYYSYLLNGVWSPDAAYQYVNLADPDLSIDWPISLDKAIISDKDRNHPMMKDIKYNPLKEDGSFTFKD